MTKIQRASKNRVVIAAVLLILAGCSSDSAESPSADLGTSEPSATTTIDGSSATTIVESPATEPTPSADTEVSPTKAAPIPVDELKLVAYPVPAGSQPHDVAPAADGGVWYTAQASGELGWLDPQTGDIRHIALGAGSRPHGVIVDSEGRAWVTDSGLNAIVSVDPTTDDVVVFPLPPDRPNANLNTAAFDGAGRLWFTGQNGVYGVLDPTSSTMEVYDSPRGAGPYGIAATPSGDIFYASLAGNYIGMVLPDGSVLELNPPTADQGSRRVWSDSSGEIWVSEWNSGQLSRYQQSDEMWTTWPLPGPDPSAYAVYVDDTDIVWVSDFGGNAIHRFDPATETFDTFDLPSNPGNVRQILGRSGEVWGAESAADQLVVIRAES